MVVVVKWSLDKMVEMITKILTNKFDCLIIIEGNRGLGKSTLGYKIGKKVSSRMKFKGIDGYFFTPKKALLYRRKEVISFFHKWRSIGIADEMINVTFNRDFYDEDQKDLIKMINMNRDHCNLFIACVPRFQTIDSQIKNLCKIRITIVRRGVCIIQTPNRTIYSKDIWDQQTNEKIEREWLQKKTKNPHYSRLTTFRGIMRFTKLSDKQEAAYQEVKDAKRNIIAKEMMGVEFTEEEEEKKDPYDAVLKMLTEGKIRSSVYLDGFAMANDILPDTFKKNLIIRLKRKGVDHRLSAYYWENKKGATTQEERRSHHDLIRTISKKISKS